MKYRIEFKAEGAWRQLVTTLGNDLTREEAVDQITAIRVDGAGVKFRIVPANIFTEEA